MRTDVRLGVFFSMVIVLTLGGYFVYPRGGTEAIPLAGDVKPATDQGTPTKLASNPQETSAGKKSATSAKKNRTARNNNGAKSKVPTQPRAIPKKSTRHSAGGTKKSNLPVSGASLGDPARTARGKSTQQRNSAARKSQPMANASQNPARATPKDLNSRQSGSQGRAVSNLAEKSGTPTPPGLLAATREKVKLENEPAVDLHRVQPGDTFATLAQAYYGSAKHVEFLMKANPNINPARMQVGVTVRVPALSAKGEIGKTTPDAEEVKPARSPATRPKTYTVRSGDSFYKIAEEILGDASRWDELFQANKRAVGNDPSRLKVGQVLTIPGK